MPFPPMATVTGTPLMTSSSTSPSPSSPHHVTKTDCMDSLNESSFFQGNPEEAYYTMVAHYDRLHLGKQEQAKCPEPDCTYASSNKADLKDHVNSRHIHFLCAKCETCFEKFYTRRNYNRHRKTHHKMEVLSAHEENGKIRKAREDDDEDLLSHGGSRLMTPAKNESTIFLGSPKEGYQAMLVHYKKLKVCKSDEIKCPERNCNYACNNKTDLKGHINSRHIHFRVIECDLCSEWFYTQKAAHTHKRCRHPDSLLAVLKSSSRGSPSEEEEEDDEEEDTRSTESADSLHKARAFSVGEAHAESELQKASSADDFSWDSDQSDLQQSAVDVLLRFQNPTQGSSFFQFHHYGLPLESSVPQGSAFPLPPIVGGKPLNFEDESLRFVENHLALEGESEYEGYVAEAQTVVHQKPSRLMISGILNPDLEVSTKVRNPVISPRHSAIPSPESLSKARHWKWTS